MTEEDEDEEDETFPMMERGDEVKVGVGVKVEVEDEVRDGEQRVRDDEESETYYRVLQRVGYETRPSCVALDQENERAASEFI